MGFWIVLKFANFLGKLTNLSHQDGLFLKKMYKC